MTLKVSSESRLRDVLCITSAFMVAHRSRIEKAQSASRLVASEPLDVSFSWQSRQPLFTGFITLFKKGCDVTQKRGAKHEPRGYLLGLCNLTMAHLAWRGCWHPRKREKENTRRYIKRNLSDVKQQKKTVDSVLEALCRVLNVSLTSYDGPRWQVARFWIFFSSAGCVYSVDFFATFWESV